MAEVTETAAVDEAGAALARRAERWAYLRTTARLVMVLVLALGLVLAARWVSDPSVMPLRLARIEGDLRYLQRAELEQAVAATLRGNFFTVDVQTVKQAAEGLAWVERVSVRRVWPDTLHLWVVEQVPFARWGEEGLVNPAGQVFRPAQTSIPSGLPLLHGPVDSGALLVDGYRRAQVLLRGIEQEVAQLQLSERRGWRLQTSSGIAVQLGQDDIETRLRRWVELYPRLRDSRPEERMHRVDMRHHNGMAIGWEKRPADADKASSSGIWNT